MLLCSVCEILRSATLPDVLQDALILGAAPPHTLLLKNQVILVPATAQEVVLAEEDVRLTASFHWRGKQFNLTVFGKGSFEGLLYSDLISKGTVFWLPSSNDSAKNNCVWGKCINNKKKKANVL